MKGKKLNELIITVRIVEIARAELELTRTLNKLEKKRMKLEEKLNNVK